MRPRELTLDGFRSYAGSTTFSWEGRDLVGIVGPIGSGKSSILDGVCFALYGRTPRLGAESKGLINQRRDEARVALTFSVDGSEWLVVRALRRRGQAAHTLYRVEDGGPVEVSDKAREVTEQIEQLIGLDYDGFRRSVMLAQGEFAAFLLGKDTDRNKALKAVFGLERLDGMRAAARRHLDRVAAELAALERLRARADQDRVDLETAAAEQEAAAGDLARLTGAQEPVTRVDRALAALDEELRALEAGRARLAEIAGRIPERRDTEALLEAQEKALGRIAVAEEAAAAAAAARHGADQVVEQTVEATGGRDLLGEASALMARLAEQQAAAARSREAAAVSGEQAAAAASASVAAEQAVERAAAAAQQAGAALAERVASRENAEVSVHEATHRDLAAGLRKDLAAGDRCPVCEQEVAEVPPAADSGLDAAREELRAARQAEQEARESDRRCAQDLAAARAAASAAAADRDRAAAEAERQASAAAEAAASAAASAATLAAMVGDRDDPQAEVAARKEALDAAERAAAAARKQESAAVAAVEEERTAAGATREAVANLATRLADLAGRLGVEVALDGDPEVLRAALVALREAWVGQSGTADARASEIDEQRTALLSERGEALEGAGLPADGDLDAAVIGARERKAAVDARVEDLTGRLAELRRLEQEQADLVERHDRYRRLHDDLSPAKFPAFVLEDRRRALAALGSERFEYLSAGRYRFTDDGRFDVVDLAAADATRVAASLSGGETFLASLALALALAEIVTREGGRLDAFFLDEGFGSLDEEHVGLAMDGIERLVTEGPDRLIVIVSHLAGLRDRLEDLIVLAKDEVTGDTAVRSGASRE